MQYKFKLMSTHLIFQEKASTKEIKLNYISKFSDV